MSEQTLLREQFEAWMARRAEGRTKTVEAGELGEALAWCDKCTDLSDGSWEARMLKVLGSEIHRLRELHLQRTKLTEKALNERDDARAAGQAAANRADDLERVSAPSPDTADLIARADEWLAGQHFWTGSLIRDLRAALLRRGTK